MGYTSGTKQHVFGTTIITSPYQDFWSKVWMVTFAKAIYDKNSIIIGVLGIDISIKNIQAEILGVHFLETGYAILCESASRESSKPQERIVVSAPDFQKRVNGGKVSLKDVIPDVTGNATLFNRLWGQSGVSYFESSSKRYLLAYSSAKSTMFRERYTVMVVIPEDEALVEIPALKKRILNTETEVVSTVSATTVLTALLTIVVVIVVTNWISNPVQAMVRIAESIVRGAAEQNLVKDFGEQEQAMDAIRDYAGIAEGFQNADKGRKHIRNEMQLLAISFLTMTSGLKRDANRVKARVIQPVNPYHTSLESEFVGELFEQKLTRGLEVSTSAPRAFTGNTDKFGWAMEQFLLPCGRCFGGMLHPCIWCHSSFARLGVVIVVVGENNNIIIIIKKKVVGLVVSSLLLIL